MRSVCFWSWISSDVKKDFLCYIDNLVFQFFNSFRVWIIPIVNWFLFKNGGKRLAQCRQIRDEFHVLIYWNKERSSQNQRKVLRVREIFYWVTRSFPLVREILNPNHSKPSLKKTQFSSFTAEFLLSKISEYSKEWLYILPVNLSRRLKYHRCNCW